MDVIMFPRGRHLFVRTAGFTLLELIIVVALIAVVVAASLPSLLALRKAANETSAMAYLRSICSAQESYRLRTGLYADSDERLVETGFMSGQSPLTGQNVVHGYTFIVDAPSPFEWFGTAAPVDPGITGDRYFYIDVSGVLRWSRTTNLDENSQQLE